MGPGTVDLRAEVLFLERHVAKQMEEYLRSLSRSMISLNEELRVAGELGSQAFAGDAVDRGKVQILWRQSLAEIEDHAKRLRKMLTPILKGFKAKSGYKPVIDAGGASSGFRDEIEFIASEVKKANQRIIDYFFAPTHVVRLDHLSGENMMICLYRVQQMSKALRKQSDAAEN
jgi:hypothetical protein